MKVHPCILASFGFHSNHTCHAHYHIPDKHSWPDNCDTTEHIPFCDFTTREVKQSVINSVLRWSLQFSILTMLYITK